jgi:cytoskeletal protein CcmA (bactofilin family)
MFSKSKPAGPITTSSATMPSPPDRDQKTSSKTLMENSTAPKPKAAPSVLSSDLTIKGNLKTSGDIQIEGILEGDIRAHLLTVGESATVKGEVIADDVVVNGRVIGCVRGLKVRLTSTARVEGDVIHKTIAIESGAHFEGSVRRNDDPLNNSKKNNLE